MNDATYLQDAWPNLDQSEKRKIVESITNKIVIGKREVEIDLCYLPSSKDMSKRDRSLQGSNPVVARIDVAFSLAEPRSTWILFPRS
jgi:hypothetical protein